MMKMEDMKVMEEGKIQQIDNHFNLLFNKQSAMRMFLKIPNHQL
jgi:hypothetical protein